MIIKFLIAHALGEVSSIMLHDKLPKKGLYLIWHCILYGAAFYLFFPYAWVFWYTSITHLLVDFFNGKLHLQDDQLLHVISLVILGVLL